MHRRLIGNALILSLLLPLLALAAGREPPPEHAGHGDHGHQMTPEQMKELRAKIPLYDMYTDEQIMYGMSRMKNLWGWMDEADGSHEGKIGVLGLAHGFKEPGNTQFREAYAGVSGEYPTVYGLGMAMMTSDHIQSAVTALEEAGAKTIVVIPTTTADNSTLTRQWDYIFGRTNVSAYLDVPRVKTNAKIIWTNTPTADPVVGQIMLDYAKEKSTEPANEVVLIVGHGPQSEEDNLKELEILAKHATFIKKSGGFADVIWGNVQDDTPPQVRQANVDKLRASAQAAIDKGQRVISVSTSLTQSGIVKRLGEDFGDITDFNNKGLSQHPAFAGWVETTVAESLD
jgi:hypothetical protein